MLYHIFISNNSLKFTLNFFSNCHYNVILSVKLPFKTSFKALKFVETLKLQKNDKNVNISSSSDRKRTNDGSLESPQ